MRRRDTRKMVWEWKCGWAYRGRGRMACGDRLRCTRALLPVMGLTRREVRRKGCRRVCGAQAAWDSGVRRDGCVGVGRCRCGRRVSIHRTMGCI